MTGTPEPPTDPPTDPREYIYSIMRTDWVLNINAFVIAALAFNPICFGDFNEDRTLYIISCSTSDGSQTIASATYSLNGNDMGNGISCRSPDKSQ